jgi:hypothetical protein
MAKIRIHVRVDSNNNVEVTGRPKRPVEFKIDEDTITFTTNRKDTAIRFVGSSPIAEFRAGSVNAIRPAKGPFTVKRQGPHHFECGRIDEDGVFQRYPTGSDIPPVC